MADIAVVDVDCETIGRITRPALRGKAEVPCSVKTGSRVCRRRNAQVSSSDESDD